MPEPSRKDEQARRRARLREQPAMPRVDAALPGYAELHCLTHFSFQRGASSPEELVRRAQALGYAALAITDECSVAGAVQAWRARAELKGEGQGEARADAAGPGSEALHLIYGSEFRFAGQGTLVALARDRPGWGDLCAFISACRRAAPKGQYRLPPLAEALAALARCECLWAPARGGGFSSSLMGENNGPHPNLLPRAGEGVFAGLDAAVAHARVSLLLELHADADDALWLAHMQRLAAASGCPLVAAGDVHMHARGAKRLHDVMCAIRLGRPVAECGFALQANAERHLRARERLAEIYPPELLAATLAVAARCTFRLDELRYDYPRESVLPGLSPTQTLRRHTVAGAHERYPRGVPTRIWRYLAKELRLIAECRYEMFFLTVHDIVCFARRRGILCQGRGSAANSVVCFCLGITAADPEHSHPLLERFISKARRSEPPDIDVDFEHERREEVIQYIYGKYGRERTALAAAVIAYRSRSALRDVGAALGVDARLVDALAKDHHGFDGDAPESRLREMAQSLGVALPDALARQWLELAAQLRGRPRHLSQHVGGFVLTETPLTRLVPIEPAAMPDRTVIQWDKDDLEALGLLKVDVLALGMLTAVRRCIDLVRQRRGQPFTRYDIQGEDPATYAMIRRADTVGVFQIESRAQMSMLPRLAPTTFYDLVVQVAIVRPGPITGGMVHPYLKARQRQRRGLPIEYERSHHDRPGTKPRLAQALERTLGIPIFQEQVMELSMLAAGFSAEKADRLRRAMAAWKKKGGLEPFERELIEGMRARGYSAAFAQRIFEQIKGFGEYGFPESHAWSFALIAYESAWLKCHEPEAWLAALLNSQPMGFYAPAQLVQDARRHGVQVLPPDVSVSDWDCTLADPHPNPIPPAGEGAKKLGSDQHFSGQPSPRPAVRLGLRMVRALAEAAARRIIAARAAWAFVDVDDLARRAALDTGELNQLAAADALASLAGHRRQQVWQAAALKAMPTLLRDAPIDEAPLALPAAGEGEAIVHDYAALGLTLRRHPLALLRPRLERQRLLTAAELQHLPSGQLVRACGLVTGRQRPATAKGTIFVTLEDETGPVNVIVWPGLRADEAQRRALLRAQLLAVEGQWQRDEGSGGQVRHLVARRLRDLTPLLGRLAGLTASRDFH